MLVDGVFRERADFAGGYVGVEGRIPFFFLVGT